MTNGIPFLTRDNSEGISKTIKLWGIFAKCSSLPSQFKTILTDSQGGNAVPDADIPRCINLIEAGKMSLEGLITHEFKPDEINEALDLFRSGEAGQIFIKTNYGAL